jgi:hypothetical protein
MTIIREMFDAAYDWAPRSVEYAVAMMVSNELAMTESMPLLIKVPATIIFLYSFFQIFNHLRPSMRKKHGGLRFWAYA